MKRTVFFLLIIVMSLSLAGCSVYPTQAADGAEWDKDWIILGSTLGVEPPGNDLTLLENPVVLTGQDTHYATWTIGSPTPYTNADGDETDLYEAQLYLLLYGCADEASAREAVSDWIAREEGTYRVSDVADGTCNGQTYTFLTYTCQSDTNPYGRGVSAFGVYGPYAVSAELSCLDSFSGDESAILTDFLNGCHYNAALSQKGD